MSTLIGADELFDALGHALAISGEFDDAPERLAAFGLDAVGVIEFLEERWEVYRAQLEEAGVVGDEDAMIHWMRTCLEGLLTGLKLQARCAA